MPHVYTSDIEEQESEVYAAASEFTAQRMGSNNNYLLDKFPSLNSQLTSIQSSALQFSSFSFSGSISPGFTVIYTAPSPIYFALIYPVPVVTNVGTSDSIGPTPNPGPTIPIVIMRAINSFQSFPYEFGNIKFDIIAFPAWTQIQINSAMGRSLSVTGVVARA